MGMVGLGRFKICSECVHGILCIQIHESVLCAGKMEDNFEIYFPGLDDLDHYDGFDLDIFYY